MLSLLSVTSQPGSVNCTCDSRSVRPTIGITCVSCELVHCLRCDVVCGHCDGYSLTCCDGYLTTRSCSSWADCDDDSAFLDVDGHLRHFLPPRRLKTSILQHTGHTQSTKFKNFSRTFKDPNLQFSSTKFMDKKSYPRHGSKFTCRLQCE